MALNIEKYQREWLRWKEAWVLGDDTATHEGGSWPNRWVEAARVSPYIAGHLEAVIWPIVLALFSVASFSLGYGLAMLSFTTN